MKIFCWIKGIISSLKRPGFYQDGIPISGHSWVDKEIHHNKTVEISECEDCGEVEIIWS